MADPRSDAELLAVVRDGDVRAYEALFHRYHERLCAYAYQLIGHDGTAEELVQDVFLFIWKRREALELQDRTVSAYLFAAVRNAAITNARRQKVFDRKTDDIIALAPQPPAASRLAETDELAAAVREAVSNLPDRCRDVVTLHREQGLTYKEVGETLGISPKTVEIHMTKAFRILRKSLAHFWDKPNPHGRGSSQ